MKSKTLMLILALTFFTALPAQARSRWYVDGVNGSDHNNCKSPQTACKTIGHAISLASPGDLIRVAAATYAENLGIPFSLEIVGSDAARTIVDGGGVASVVLILNPKAHVTLSQMTLRNGGGQGDGGGVYNCFATVTIVNSILSGNSATSGMGNLGYGGAIYNCPGSTMTIINSTFTRNSAEEGGAICNGGTLTISKSTFSGNTARQRKGGAIRSYGTLMISNSTISGNRAMRGSGGGIHNGQLFGQTGTLVISNSTISGNIAGDGRGGGIFNLNGITLALQNSIIANNTGGNCSGTMTSNGYNLSSDSTCNFNGAGDLNNTDPKLGPLLYNGGRTRTMALLQRSPAIDSGNPNGCTDGFGHLLKTDQRGKPRPDKEDHGVGCDRGAFERQTD
jgi:predicted outer membrane repeat protein